MNTEKPFKQPTKQIQVQLVDLPLHCPLPGVPLWNAHPRVFLEIDKTPDHTIRCPYCSTEYKLTTSTSEVSK